MATIILAIPTVVKVLLIGLFAILAISTVVTILLFGYILPVMAYLTKHHDDACMDTMLPELIVNYKKHYAYMYKYQYNKLLTVVKDQNLPHIKVFDSQGYDQSKVDLPLSQLMMRCCMENGVDKETRVQILHYLFSNKPYQKPNKTVADSASNDEADKLQNPGY